MMTFQTDVLPIHEEGDGSLRVGRSRVLLELVINAFDDGDTPETIAQNYETLQLADVYGVISYYLNHREEIREYMARRDERAADVYRKLTAGQRDLSELRARLKSNRSKQG